MSQPLRVASARHASHAIFPSASTTRFCFSSFHSTSRKSAQAKTSSGVGLFAGGAQRAAVDVDHHIRKLRQILDGEEVHANAQANCMSDSKQRFSSRVQAYVKARPKYPRQVIDHLRGAIDLQPTWTIADVGSGTGIS